MNVKKIIDAWFASKNSNSSQDDFANWLEDHSDRDAKEQALWEQWQGMDNASMECEELDAAYSAVFDRISAKSEKPQRVGIVKRLGLAKVASIAAAFILPIATTLFFLQYAETIREESQFEMLQCYVPNGQTETIILPDSSKIIVNSGTTIIYPSKFNGQKREVFLIGEASFYVQRAEEHPFVVHATDVDVQVLGTTFNVEAYAGSDETKVSLKAGHVLVETQGVASKSIDLVPGEQLSYMRSSGKVEVDQIEVDDEFAWESGDLLLNCNSIIEIIDMIERRYDVNIYLNTNKYDNASINAEFSKDETIEDVMSVLSQLISGFTYTINDGTIYIN